MKRFSLALSLLLVVFTVGSGVMAENSFQSSDYIGLQKGAIQSYHITTSDSTGTIETESDLIRIVVTTIQKPDFIIFKIIQISNSPAAAKGLLIAKKGDAYYIYGSWDVQTGAETVAGLTTPFLTAPIQKGDVYEFTDESLKIKLSLTAVREEQITTNAGTYTAWLYQGAQQVQLNGVLTTIEQSRWLAPYSGTIKTETKATHETGQSKHITMELTSYKE